MSKCANCGDLIPTEVDVCPRCGAKKGAGLDKDFTKRLRIAGFPRIADAVEALQEELEQVTKERDAVLADFFAIQKDVGKYIWDTTGGCALCKHEGKKPCPNAELRCSECWEWRGLQKEG